jgi:serine/threonine-protein kinase
MPEYSIDPKSDPMIGQRIRGYVVCRKLAEGGMGAVYVADHELLENTQKVIKILLPEYARNAMLRERFEREAHAVSRLRHRHIIKIDDYGQLPDGQLFLMMPFLHGRPLDAYLRERGTLTEHLALHILVQVCSALQHMHDAGIVHRDIKPSNIFLVDDDDDNPYHVVLIDLGIAKNLADREHATRTGSAMGTPAYMAVEQYENAGDVTPLADVYSVAIVIWEMLVGSLPWGMHGAQVLYEKQKHERLVRPSGLSQDWFAILSVALAVRAYDRPQSMRELAVALASTVPAIPPHVPSGAEILTKLAKTFVQQAPPGDETMRNSAHSDRVAPILWPPRETPSAAALKGGLPPLNVHTVSSLNRPPGVARGARGDTPVVNLPTTLTAYSGVAVPRTSSRRTPLVFAAAIAAALVAGIVAYTMIHQGGALALDPAAAPIPEPVSSSVAPVDAAIDAIAAAASAPGPKAELPAPVPDAAIREAVRPIDGLARPRFRKSVTSPKASTELPLAKPPPSDGRASDDHRGSNAKFDPNAVGGGE